MRATRSELSSRNILRDAAMLEGVSAQLHDSGHRKLVRANISAFLEATSPKKNAAAEQRN